MLRRPTTKLMAIIFMTFVVFCVVIFRGNHLSDGVQSGYVEGLNHHWRLSLKTTSKPAPTTPVWQNPDYAERRQHSDNVCSTLREGWLARLTHYNNTSYCVVPKVGCTFWINIFRFLHGDTGGKRYNSPFQIPRMITHYGHLKTMRYYSINNTYAPQHLANDLRFMFVRDPYSRLWSAYVDKFLLVDYWHTEGQHIVKARPHQKNTTLCANDISFKEFLEYVASLKSRAMNEHWKPIQYLCSPCLFRPHVIGKMETFSRDSRYILQLMNISWILDTYDHEQHVYQEMDMLISYNFQMWRSTKHNNCTNATDLSRRLWRTFQINGYIPSEMNFPDPGPAGLNSSMFRRLAHDAYRNRPVKSPNEWKQQREQAMVDAFKDISIETLVKLKKIYKDDFELFGYDPEPEKIFKDRSR